MLSIKGVEFGIEFRNLINKTAERSGSTGGLLTW
jgi:hypothetical protein